MKATNDRYTILVISPLLAALSATNTLADEWKAQNDYLLAWDASWTNAVAPGSTEFGVWSSIVTGPMTNTLGADLNWGGIKVINPAGPINIKSGNTLIQAPPAETGANPKLGSRCPSRTS